MKEWSWQKWLGKLAPVVTGLIATGIWAFLELPAPGWAGTAAGVLTTIVQAVIALFPAKTA